MSGEKRRAGYRARASGKIRIDGLTGRKTPTVDDLVKTE